MGRARGARGTRVGLGRTGPDWAGLGCDTPRIKTHNTHDH
jgi:hypothetical protein